MLTRLITLSLLALGTRAQAAPACSGAAAIDPARELFINQPAVVGGARAEPGGPWHFSTLVRAMLPAGASDADFTAFVKGWLSSWDSDQVLTPDPAKPAGTDNPDRTLAKRPGVASGLFGAWLSSSEAARAAAGKPEDGTLVPDLAPFALRAVVYRPDRRDLTRCATSAGEGRFVFGALKQPTAHPTTTPADGILEMTVIFEYDLPPASGTAQGWAGLWHALAENPCDATGCDAYLSTLETLTGRFAKGGVFPGRPAGNALAQVRTNELIDFPSELRQFALAETSPGHTALTSVPVAQTPDFSLNGSAALGDWALANRSSILAETHVVPPALAAFTAPSPRATKWQIPNPGNLSATDLESLRFELSKNSCNGCHSFEHPKIFDVDGTWHVSPEGRASKYLTQEELPRRQGEVCDLINLDVCADQTSGGEPVKRGRGH
jgi:hypothetical protein